MIITFHDYNVSTQFPICPKKADLIFLNLAFIGRILLTNGVSLI